MLSEEACWEAVKRRDPGQDGAFFFGVTTTGIFCRPSCASRRPLRKNVRFFESAAEAEEAGLRACLRCHPKGGDVDSHEETVRDLCEFIRAHCDSGEPLTLAVLSRRAGMKPHRLRRLFRDSVGVTPRQYVEACRFEILKKGLREGEAVTDAIYEAGFGSSSRVYEQAGERLGMTPSEYRAGGPGLEITYLTTDTPLGPMLLAATDRGLCSVRFGESREALVEALRDEFWAARLEAARGTDGPLEAWVAALRDHLAGRPADLDLPLDVRATSFQLQVWRYLQTIPSGETRSYGEVAAALGRPRAHRAVARACAGNRVALVIPCHRVIRASGELGGYRWGEERKAKLLRVEGEVAAEA